MPYIKKPAFETFRSQLIASGKPIAEKDIVPIQARIVTQLDTIRELLVQKARRLSHKDGLVEITATWVGLDASQKEAVAILKRSWPGAVFESSEEQFWVGDSEEAVLLNFAVRYPEDRYLTGRILVTF